MLASTSCCAVRIVRPGRAWIHKSALPLELAALVSHMPAWMSNGNTGGRDPCQVWTRRGMA